MHSRLLRTAVTCLAVVALPLALQAPASAKDEAEKDKKPKKGVELTETGCRDVVNGGATYTQDRDASGAALDSGTAQLVLVLAAPSCPEVTYTSTVYGADGTVLDTQTFVGDGVKGTGEDPVVLTSRVTGYTDRCLMLVGTTSVDGVVIDTAPDAVQSYRDVCDGGSPGLTYR